MEPGVRLRNEPRPATIALAFARHRLASWVGALTGVPILIGVAAVHLLPHWSAFSDAFPGARGSGVTPLSWAVVLLEIAGALALGTVGTYAVTRGRVHA